MEGGYVRWQRKMMEEVHKAVLKRKRVCDDKIIPVPDKIRDHDRLAFSYPRKTHTHDMGVMGVTCQWWMRCLTTTLAHHHQSFPKHSKHEDDKSKKNDGTWERDRHNQGMGIPDVPMSFSLLFVYWLFQQHYEPCLCHSPHRQWTSPCRPTLSWHSQYDWVTCGCSPPPHDAMKHWGACSAPWLSFLWLFDPHKVAWQCRLTLALPLWVYWSFLKVYPCAGYLQVFINPLPIPTKNHA